MFYLAICINSWNEIFFFYLMNRMNQANHQSSIHVFRRLIESRESDCDEVLQNLKGLSSILNNIVSVKASDALLTDILSPLLTSSLPLHSSSVGNKIAARLFLDAESIFSNISSVLFVSNSMLLVLFQYLYDHSIYSQEAVEGARIRLHFRQQQCA